MCPLSCARLLIGWQSFDLNIELEITDLCEYGSSSKKLDRKAVCITSFNNTHHIEDKRKYGLHYNVRIRGSVVVKALY
jgi:hypothetical protein